MYDSVCEQLKVILTVKIVKKLWQNNQNKTFESPSRNKRSLDFAFTHDNVFNDSQWACYLWIRDIKQQLWLMDQVVLEHSSQPWVINSHRSRYMNLVSDEAQLSMSARALRAYRPGVGWKAHFNTSFISIPASSHNVV